MYTTQMKAQSFKKSNKATSGTIPNTEISLQVLLTNVTPQRRLKVV